MRLRDNVIQALEHKETLWIPSIYTDIDFMEQTALNELYRGKESGYDDWGVHFTYVPIAGAPMVTSGSYILQDIKEWKDKVKIPDVDSFDWKEAALRDTASWDRENKFSVIMLSYGPFERVQTLLNMENALIAFLTDSEAVSEFIGEFVEYRIKMIDKIVQYYKADAIMVFDDYGMGSNMFLPPDVWRKVIKPHLKRHVEAAHEKGLYYIQHSDGYVGPIFKDFIEIGVDAAQPVEYVNNTPELKKKYGKQITFCSGYKADKTLDDPNATEEQMRADVRNVLNELGKGGSYIAFPEVVSRRGQEIFFEELRKINEPKMIKAGVKLPDWSSVARRFKD